MKNIILLFLISFTSATFAQIANGLAPDPSSSFNGFTKLDDGFLRLRTDPKKVEVKGTVYAFKDWGNIGSLHIDGKNHHLADVNFNMWTNTIESRVGKDSVYIFDLANVEYASINNRKFKSFYFAKENKDKIFEVLYDGDEFTMLKGYEVGIKRGDPDPLMVKKVVNKYFTTKTYYIKDGNNFKAITLKKKSMLPLFKDKANVVGVFVKQNKLSFKKDKDLKKIFDYYNSL